jgi:hypothetical protein
LDLIPERARHDRGGDIGSEFAEVNLMHQQRIEPRRSIGYRKVRVGARSNAEPTIDGNYEHRPHATHPLRDIATGNTVIHG